MAVIIGNKDYAGSVPDVDFAHNDAEAMKRFVIDVLGFREGNIIDLSDATQAQMASAFGNERSHEAKLWSWVKQGKSDVVVFYSGHGVPGLKDGRGYLLPVDADPDTPEFNGYPVDLLYANLAKLKARSVTVYLDACFSGESPKGRLTQAASSIGLSHVPKKVDTGITVITAARGDQLASWDEEAEHGLFTRYLLEGLYGAADGADYGDGDGNVTLAELQTYLDDEMTYAARRTYLRRQQATVRGDEGFVLASVPEAAHWSACLTSPSFGCVIAQSLTIARTIEVPYFRDWYLADIAAALAEAGDVPGALVVARTVEDAEFNAEALKDIARVQAKAGDVLGAKEIIAQALALANISEDTELRANVLKDIARVQAQVGDAAAAGETIAQALTIANTIEDTSLRAYLLKDIARVQEEVGGVESALDIANTIEQTIIRAEILRDLARVQAEAGDVAGALVTAKTIEAPVARDWALHDVARAQAEEGDVAGALETVRIIDEDPASRAGALIGIATAQIAAGGVADAKENIALALAIANTIASASMRAQTIADIASAQVEAGELETAKETIIRGLATAEIAEDISRDFPLIALATAQAEAEDVAGALAIAMTIGGSSNRDWAFLNIARAQADAGDAEGARETLTQALAIANAYDGAIGRTRPLVAIANTLAKLE